jgi:hypothetical protein
MKLSNKEKQNEETTYTDHTTINICKKHKIYGIRLFTCKDGKINTLYEYNDNAILSKVYIDEVKKIYNSLETEERENVICNIYTTNTRSSSIVSSSMIWKPFELHHIIS